MDSDWHRRWHVIIPSHNEGYELIDTIESVLEDAARWDGEVRVLAVDDQSEDFSGMDATNRFLKDDRVLVLETPERSGCAGAKRWGVSQSLECWPEAGVFFFLDAHSRLQRGFFEAAAEGLALCGQDAQYGPVIGVMGADPPDECWGAQLKIEGSLHDDWTEPKRSNRPYPVMRLLGGAHIIPSALYTRLSGFDSGLRSVWGHEDLEITLRGWLLGFECRLIPEAKVETWFRDKTPYGNHSNDGHFRNLVRCAFGLLDREHFVKLCGYYRDYEHFRYALHDLMCDVEELDELRERRKQFVMTTAELFSKFAAEW